jgi:phosphoribosyl 1,2-cyclic phosphodiesterase
MYSAPWPPIFDATLGFHTHVSGASTPETGISPGQASNSTESAQIQPYICFGFKISVSVVYLADVSHIPDDAWSLLEHHWTSPLPVFVCDCLRLYAHTSHFGLGEAIAASRRIGAIRTYLTGFGHEVSHDEYVTFGEVEDRVWTHLKCQMLKRRAFS